MRESPSSPWRTSTLRSRRAGLALVLLVCLAAACSSDDQPGPDAGVLPDGASADAMAPDGGPPDVAAGEAGAAACAPPPPNYPICPAAPCTNDQSPPGCSEVCLVGHCYSCQPNGTWVTSVVDCVRGDAGAASGG
jgi:hypothetical protein